ncbi:MAG TPA: hypothetical protein VGY30_04310 [Solirubrobacteraceae bacterium]|nr:hypothetical protein [Solirubrobacteraceae bacterium]
MRGVAQISRPFQIALAAVALLGLVWVVALHGHAPGQHESTGAAPAPASTPNAEAQAKAAAKPTPIYHGAAPGVEGLTRAIAKAHEAVGASQRNAQELAQHSREASQESAASSGASAAHVSAAQAHANALARSAAAARAHEAVASVQRLARQHAAAKHAAGNRPAAQVAVEHEVAHSKTVLLLFWNSKSSVDREVRSETTAMVRSSKGTLALHVAAPNQVGEFGSLTEVVHVYQTPTILIVNQRGVVSTLTGLTDIFALKQLVHEAQRAIR